MLLLLLLFLPNTGFASFIIVYCSLYGVLNLLSSYLYQSNLPMITGFVCFFFICNVQLHLNIRKCVASASELLKIMKNKQHIK